MEGTDLLFFGVVFAVVYYLTDPTKKNFQKKETGSKSILLEQQLHAIRTRGIDSQRMADIAGELARRGVPVGDIPRMPLNLTTSNLCELQAKLELLLQETPYLPRDKGEPGEDHTLSKSSFQVWPRSLEEDNGDV
jgi:hypothetical protein